MSANLSDSPMVSASTSLPDAPVAANPLGLAGLEFVEFAAPQPAALGEMFERLGFVPLAHHISKAVTMYGQGEIRFLVNGEPDSFAERYAQEYGLSICAIGLRVHSAKQAFKRALALGAWPFEGERVGPTELKLPAIQGIGDSHLYFVDRWPGKPVDTRTSPQSATPSTASSTATEPSTATATATAQRAVQSIYEVDFSPIDAASTPSDVANIGLRRVDHFTQTVGAGRMQEWLDFYRELFNFREIQEIHPEWPVSNGSRVVVSPCGAIRIPLYEEGSQRTQAMHQFLPDHPGEGVQHIALASDDIFASVDALVARGVEFIEWPASYYEQIDDRLPGHGLDVDALRQRHILVDGSPGRDGGVPPLFLQAFIRHRPGEIFFEIVERRGHSGFGEGNLDAFIRSQIV